MMMMMMMMMTTTTTMMMMMMMMRQTEYFSTLNIFIHSALVNSEMKSIPIW